MTTHFVAVSVDVSVTDQTPITDVLLPPDRESTMTLRNSPLGKLDEVVKVVEAAEAARAAQGDPRAK